MGAKTAKAPPWAEPDGLWTIPPGSAPIEVWLGIDPGITGGLGFIFSDSAECDDIPTRVWRDREQVDVFALYQRIVPFRDRGAAVLERAQPMPRDGSAGSFRYGETYGGIKAALRLSGIPFFEVAANQWRPKLVGRGTSKDDARTLAVSLFPALAPRLTRKKDHGRAEALLLAEFGRRATTKILTEGA